MTTSFFADGVFTVVVFLVCLVCFLYFGALLTLKSTPRLTTSGRRSRFEALECRLPLDTQIGIVSMPYTGYLSAGVYDSGGQLVRTLLERSPQVTGNVTLMWDGKDFLGRTVLQDGTYTWKALASQVEAVDQGGVGDSAFNPLTFEDADSDPAAVAVDTDSFMGEVGGTFARAQTDSFFGDTSIATFSLSNTITGSGKFDVGELTSGWTSAGNSGFFIGHFSEAGADSNREFIGLEFNGEDASFVKVRARFQTPTLTSSEDSEWIYLALNSIHTFSYTYNPSLGTNGRLTVSIDALSPLVVDLGSGARNSGAQFDAFGLGFTNNLNSESDSTKTARVFIDDVSYSGFTGVQNFNSNPSWTGSNNTTGGNNFGWGPITAPGGMYTGAWVQEGVELDRIALDGSHDYQLDVGAIVGITSDGNYVYITRRIGNVDRVDRFHARGFATPFTQASGGYITVNNGAYDPRPAGQNSYTT
jgi:hypothetical protein